MKVFSAILCLSFILCGVAVDVTAGQEGSGSVTISYVLHRIPKIASNQVAVWIEDESGKYVKTLFATRFTARVGFKKRPQALPEWVNASKWENAAATEVDAVSGATQKAGDIELTWDCTDRSGNPVAAGTYVYKIEGNIYWDNRVLWRGKIAVGGKRYSSNALPTYYPDGSSPEDTLVEEVHAVFEPLH